MVPSPIQTPNSSWVPECVYPSPVSELFRCKVFWLRGLGQKLGQRFAVCGRNSSMSHKPIAGLRLFVFRHTRRLTRRAAGPFLCRLKAETLSEWDNCCNPPLGSHRAAFSVLGVGLLRSYAGNAPPIWGRLLFMVEMTWNEMRRRGRALGATL